MRRISIFGSTGSIGKNAIRIIKSRINDFQIIALTAHQNVKLLAKQAREVNAKIAVIGDEELYTELKAELADTSIQVAAGKEALLLAAALEADLLIAAVVGIAGLAPTLAAVKAGTHIALANKEALVCGGNIVMDEAVKNNVQIIPIDSEHSAIFQLLDFERIATVEKIILTASGGPFRTFSLDQMRDITVEQALKHPNWVMGAKITIDSATMMNKGLEIIEAHYLFKLKEEQIEVLIHPESIIHSMVCYQDGAVLAQMGTPDMCLPISYALSFPARYPALDKERLDFSQISRLTFELPNVQKFPSLVIAREALRLGLAAQIILNSSNEILVAAFLKQQISFLKIAELIERCLEQLSFPTPESIDDIAFIDHETRRFCRDIL
jgi:1-deoxy-D-xylulose-5-phosphate reductoisomerase